MSDKPILVEIVRYKGDKITGARVQHEAPEIPGFLAIESPEIKGATQYIALSNIADFTAIDEELCNIVGNIPEPKVIVKQNTAI